MAPPNEIIKIAKTSIINGKVEGRRHQAGSMIHWSRVPLLNTCFALFKPIRHDKTASITVLFIVVLCCFSSMVPVQAQEQVTTQQETIFGHTIDVMIIDSECLDEQLCHAWRPLHLIEYYGADWCEPCLDVELSLENIDTTKYAVIQHLSLIHI